ncbi:Hypothetical protein R9X50_00390300 [Acrodontium crateriforme]|uniref:Ribosomal protein S36, mitochondrial n=1 Tax=Acrodontium crateriforme TaxID=150365 RepID=A0AAQ3M4G5_9PEZI|nr:Hypothetical protein R9X50_00390300 [Acrodontium crateriforme]
MFASTRVLMHRQPMIRFIGKRSIPQQVDHAPHAHPASPDHTLPESFSSYRQRATSHGPLGGGQQRVASSAASVPSTVMSPYGAIGGHSAKQLGSVKPASGEFWDRSQLPKRFQRLQWSEAEIEAIESGGASMHA